MIIKALDLGTHYHEKTRLVFFVGKCENCGREAREVNSVHVNNPAPYLLKAWKAVDTLPPEVTIIDSDTGECGCEDCA